jgi:predicted metalloprotease with PDZ domain
MTRLLSLFALLLALPLMGAAPAPVLTYELSPVMTAGRLTAVAVTLRFQADEDGETRLALPDNWGGKDALYKHLDSLTVEGGTVREDGATRRVVSHAPGAMLVVRYRVSNGYAGDPDAADDNPYRPIVRPDWFHLLGNTWVVQPDGRGRQAASVTWTGWPKDWAIASDLQHPKKGERLNLGGVIESVALGGRDVKVLSRKVPGGTLRVAMRGAWLFTNAEFTDDVAKVISAQRDFFDDVEGPFLVTLIPVEAPAGWQSVGGAGRGDAFALFSTRGDVGDELRGILGHEHIHSWVPREMVRMPEPEQTDYWLSEGFTDFYAWRTQLRGGVWSLEQYIAALNDAFREFDGSKARSWPNAKVAEAFWNDGAAQRMPYRRGAFLAMRWDEQLRRESGGRIDLDNVVLGLRNQVRAAETWDEVPEARPGLIAMMTARGLDPTEDIARYIDGGEIVPLDGEWFRGCVIVETMQVPVFDRGWDVAKTSSTGVVTGLDPEHPAYAAGLRDGMKILKREGGAPGDSRVAYVLRVKDGEVERVIRFQPEGKSKMPLRTARLAGGLDRAGRERCRKAVGGI